MSEVGSRSEEQTPEQLGPKPSDDDEKSSTADKSVHHESASRRLDSGNEGLEQDTELQFEGDGQERQDYAIEKSEEFSFGPTGDHHHVESEPLCEVEEQSLSDHRLSASNDQAPSKMDDVRGLGAPSASMSGLAAASTASGSGNVNPRPSGGMLLRLFQSECFDSYLHLYYLFKREESGIHDYLVNLLYRRRDEEVHFYLPQLCQLAVNRQHSTLSRFLLDKSARNMHFALKGSWLFHSAVEDRIDRLSEAASKMREEMEMAVVNSKPFSGNAAEPGQLTPSHAFPQKSPDLFLRQKAVKAAGRYRHSSSRAFIQRAMKMLARDYGVQPQASPSPRDSPASAHVPPSSIVSGPNTVVETTLASQVADTKVLNSTAPSAPPVERSNNEAASTTSVPPSAPQPQPQPTRTVKKKGRVAPGFVTLPGMITVEGSKIRLMSVYMKLQPPFNYTSFSRESRGVLLDDQEMQQYIIKQRRCEYFNLVGQFINSLIEVSEKLVSEPDKSLRTPLVRTFLRSLDEWNLCRRCIVAASEGIFAMTGLAIPFTNFGVEPETATTLGVPAPLQAHFLVLPTPPATQAPPQLASLQLLRVATDECKVFSSKKRAPFLFVFELADLDEDLHDLVNNLSPTTQRKNGIDNTRASTREDGGDSENVILDDSETSPRMKNRPNEDSAAKKTDNVTWNDLYVYGALVKDLKQRELYIPPFLTRPLSKGELAIIEEPSLRNVSCDVCLKTDTLDMTYEEGPKDVPRSRCPFRCPDCGGTQVFCEAVEKEQHLIAVRRSLGVPIPTWIPGESVRPSRLQQSREHAPRKHSSQPKRGDSSPRSLSDGRRTRDDADSDSVGRHRALIRRSSSLSPGASRTHNDGVVAHEADQRKSTSALPSIANMLAFGRTQEKPVGKSSTPTTPRKSSTGTTTMIKAARDGTLRSDSPILSNSAMVTTASAEHVVCALTLPEETNEQRALRVRRSVWGELWEEKKERIRQNSPYGDLKSWQLAAVLVKGGDDVRQELLASQLTRQLKAIFDEAKLPLWLRPYEILVTGSHSGIMEFVPDTQSVDAIKRRFQADSVAKVFEAAFADNLPAAKKNFIESHAAYSLLGYLLQVKDRHNGNLLLTATGRIVHIDYGFMLFNSPGYVNFETSPFKLSAEFMAIMDGDGSENFDYFRELIIKGFLEVRKHADRIFLIVEMMLSASKMPCFGGAPEAAFAALKERFFLNTPDTTCVQKIVDLIDASINNWRTAQYDNYQRLTNGIW